MTSSERTKKGGKKRGNSLAWKEQNKRQTNLSEQLEEINQKILTKEGSHKRYRDRVKQYKQKKTSKNNVRKFYQKLGGYKKTEKQPYVNEVKLIGKNMAKENITLGSNVLITWEKNYKE